ncbi:hypothetical protein VitviT2T_014122 [Vitis vinifera]|uniref:ENTH domain-containing protein n=1 Tax=Vitis vinifera TaxID=29760 RepID=A0ABY9CJM6_VITVI|nr:hypothetical protein VitviT2T_014122 [Vitis vinifera]
MEPENTSNSVIMANLYSQADYGRIVEILHSRLLRFDRKNRRASYNSLNLPEYLLAHGPKSVANEFQSEKDVKGEDVEDIHVTINQVQVTDESAEYLKSGSVVFSVLRNLGKSEEGEAVRNIFETNNQIRIQGADGSDEYFQSCSVSNIFGTGQNPLAEKPL